MGNLEAAKSPGNLWVNVCGSSSFPAYLNVIYESSMYPPLRIPVESKWFGSGSPTKNIILLVVTIASWERATPEALPSTISIIYILILDSSFGPSAIIILHAMTHFPPDIKKTLTCQDTEDSSQRVYCRKGRDPGNILPFKIKLTTVGWPSTPVGVDSLSAYIIMQDWL